MFMTLSGLDRSAGGNISGRLGACMSRTSWRVLGVCWSVGHACVFWRYRHDRGPCSTGTTYHGPRRSAECKSSVRAHQVRTSPEQGGQAVRRDGAMVCLGGGQTAGLAVHAEGAAGDRPPLVLLARSAAARYAQRPQSSPRRDAGDRLRGRCRRAPAGDGGGGGPGEPESGDRGPQAARGRLTREGRPQSGRPSEVLRMRVRHVVSDFLPGVRAMTYNKAIRVIEGKLYAYYLTRL